MSATLPLFASPALAGDHAANSLAAARALLPHLARGRPLDRRRVSGVLTTAFGGTDAEGSWDWRDAYDAIEAATVLQIRRLSAQVGRLEDAPAEVIRLLAAIAELGLTQTRRSEEQLALDQFSAPAPLAALAVLAAQVRPGDKVLEPSAGVGLIAAVAAACGAELALNELSERRAGLLDGLFADAARTRHDAVHLPDLLPAAQPSLSSAALLGRRRAALGHRPGLGARRPRAPGDARTGGPRSRRPGAAVAGVRQARHERRDRLAGAGPRRRAVRLGWRCGGGE